MNELGHSTQTKGKYVKFYKIYKINFTTCKMSGYLYKVITVENLMKYLHYDLKVY